MFLKPLKLNRLLLPSAWNNLDLIETILYLLILICGLVVVWPNGFTEMTDDTTDKLFNYIGAVMSVAALSSIIWRVLHDVCYPLKVCKLDDGRTKLYVYKNKENMFELVLHKAESSETIFVADYDVPFNGKTVGCFTYSLGKENVADWFVYNVRERKTEKLGRRLNKILFISSKKDGGISVLFSDGSVQRLHGDYIVYDDLYIPADAKVLVPQDVDGKTKSMPDKFLFIQKDGSYKTYGFFLSDEKTGYSEVFISSVIFREGEDRLLLEFNGEVYKVRLRTQDLSRELSNYFLELTDDYRVGGKVYRYDGKTKSLDVIYEGNFRYIEFDDGTILGDDGKTYGPNTLFS